MSDKINPDHYKQGEIEVIDYILDQKFSYLEGNIVKYVSRYKFKNGIEDLKKAHWYLKKLIELEESRAILNEAMSAPPEKDYPYVMKMRDPLPKSKKA
jgi:hypothetical protein